MEDVDLVLTTSEAESPPNLLQLLRCCLIYSTLGSLSTNVPPQLLGTLVYLGRLDQARDFADHIQVPGQRMQAYLFIGDILLDRGETSEARKFILQALQVAEGINIETPEEVITANVFSSVAPALADVGELDLLIEAVKNIWQQYYFHPLILVAEELSQNDAHPSTTYLAERLIASTDGLKDKELQADVASRAVLVFARGGEFQQAEALAKEIEISEYHNDALVGLSSVLAEEGQFDEATRMAKQITDTGTKILASSQICLIFAKLGKRRSLTS